MPFFENVYLILGFYAKDRQNEDKVGGVEARQIDTNWEDQKISSILDLIF